MTISTNIHLLQPVFTIQGYVPTPRGPDLSFSRWPRCYKSRRSFPVYLAALSPKAVQCPRLGPKIGNKSQQTPRYYPVCPRGQPPGMAADKCITALFAMTYLICSTILRETFSEAIFIFPSQYLPAICKLAEPVR